MAYQVFIKVKVFIPKSAKVEVKIWYLLRNKIQKMSWTLVAYTIGYIDQTR